MLSRFMNLKTTQIFQAPLWNLDRSDELKEFGPGEHLGEFIGLKEEMFVDSADKCFYLS